MWRNYMAYVFSRKTENYGARPLWDTLIQWSSLNLDARVFAYFALTTSALLSFFSQIKRANPRVQSSSSSEDHRKGPEVASRVPGNSGYSQSYAEKMSPRPVSTARSTWGDLEALTGDSIGSSTTRGWTRKIVLKESGLQARKLQNLWVHMWVAKFCP